MTGTELSCGCRSDSVFVLPCSLTEELSRRLGIELPVVRDGDPLRVLFIGRLETYKRLDWLMTSLATLTSLASSVVGDGSKRMGSSGWLSVCFLTRHK